MDMNEAVARAIAGERQVAGMTVRSLAEAADIPERSLMRILQAEREIKVNQVAAVADALGLFPHEIIEHAETILKRSVRKRPDLSEMTPSNVTVGRFGKDDEAEGERTDAAAMTTDRAKDDGSDEGYF